MAFPRYRLDSVDEWLGFDLRFRTAYHVYGEQTVLTGETTIVDIARRTGRRGGAITFVVY